MVLSPDLLLWGWDGLLLLLLLLLSWAWGLACDGATCTTGWSRVVVARVVFRQWCEAASVGV